jgi:hypothetical protein
MEVKEMMKAAGYSPEEFIDKVVLDDKSISTDPRMRKAMIRAIEVWELTKSLEADSISMGL